MSVFHPGSEDRPSSRTVRILIAVAIVVIAAAVVLLRRPGPPPAATERAPGTSPPARPSESLPPEAAPAPASPTAAAPVRAKPRRDASPAESPAPPATVRAGPVLIVESDVPGASVFVDRKYLGTAPLRTSDVGPGTHLLNASAEGEDGIVRTIEVPDTGASMVTLKFREVVLNESVAVVHKHAMGSCEGTLVASVAGLRYDTSNKGDAFTLPMSDVEAFEVDYLQRNLRVKRRGGKTWNFTDRTENADRLFVFHRDVAKARTRLQQ